MRAAPSVPVPSPTLPSIAEDEKDFLGLTSLALGSGARAFGMGGAFLFRGVATVLTPEEPEEPVEEAVAKVEPPAELPGDPS